MNNTKLRQSFPFPYVILVDQTVQCWLKNRLLWHLLSTPHSFQQLHDSNVYVYMMDD